MHEVLYFWQYIIKEPYWQFKFILQPILFPQLMQDKIRYNQLMGFMRHPLLARTTHQKGAPEGHTQGAF